MEGSIEAPLPLHTTAFLSKTTKNSNIYRVLTLLRAGFLFCFLKYRLDNPIEDLFAVWLLAGCCEIIFSINFIFYSILKWRPVERETYPHRLSSRYEKSGEAPKFYPVDIFITTADPQKESPLVTANTLLSVLAVDYPADRVACYVSDDAAFPITFCMMLEVSKFAQKWVPFCKNFSIQPAQFLFTTLPESTDSAFCKQWKVLKEEFEQLKSRLNFLAVCPEEALKIASQHASWPTHNPSDHPSIVEVVVPQNNIVIDGCQSSIPLLVYIAREKREDFNHHYKAGALNALMRVSGVFSNSPIILNLDCDMYINDSKALRHAMCFFMDPNLEQKMAFLQFPQVFDNVVRRDVYGNRLVFLYDVLLKGLDGIQGPFYCGTGCFHRRRSLLGFKPGNGAQEENPWSMEEWRSRLGSSPILVKSAALTGQVNHDSSLSLKAAIQVCSCNYEQGTSWGKQVGWRYGSNTEDVLTGYQLHCMGWRSIYLCGSRPVFKGIAPVTASDRLAQRKRIAAGLVTMLFMKSSPLFYGQQGLMFLQRIAYIYNCMFYAGISVLVMLYAILHAACLFSAKSLTPKVTEVEIIWFVAALGIQHGMSFLEYRWADESCSIEEWWNQERFWFISNVSCFLLGTVEALFKTIGLVESEFTVTPKNSSDLKNNESGPYAITGSLLFIPPVTLLMLFLLAIIASLLRVMKEGMGTLNNIGGQLMVGMWCIAIMYPFLRQILRNGFSKVAASVMLPSVVAVIFLSIMIEIFVHGK